MTDSALIRFRIADWQGAGRTEFHDIGHVRQAIGVNFEFPWFYRTPDDMREQGKKAFVAFALAVIETEHL